MGDAEEEPTWRGFFGRTTFHGVRYIFQDRRVRFRGICWFIFVVAALSVFTYQVVDRAKAYFRYESTVNVEMMYKERMPFPSVTICNQNSIRLSAVVDDSVFEFLGVLFHNESVDPESMDRFRKSLNITRNTTEFLMSVAHQKEDLIDSCKWRGQPCNMTHDIQVMLTDLGVCYTFAPRDQKMEDSDDDITEKEVETGGVTQSGTRNGLSLVLNLEEYEYTQFGGSSDPGLKLLLHSTSDFPLVRDLGFAVAPGTHSLVAIDRTTVSNLEPPWGKCDSSEDRPMSLCSAQCRARQVRHQCGCSDPYLQNMYTTNRETPTNTSESLCDLTSTFMCLSRNIESLAVDSFSCNCTLPCEQELYQPSLSYAQLSRHTITQLVLTDNHKRSTLYNKFMTAREAAQHVFEEIKTADQELIGELINASLTYQEKLEDSIGILENATKFKVEYPSLVAFPNVIRHVLESDTDKLNAVRRYQTVKSYFSPRGTSQLNEWYNRVVSNSLDRHRGSHEYELLTNLYRCKNVTEDPGNATMLDCDEMQTGVRKNYFTDTKLSCTSRLNQCTAMKGYSEANAEKYRKVVFGIFNDTDIDPMTYQEHSDMVHIFGSLNTSIYTLCDGLEILVGEHPLDDVIEAVEVMKTRVDPWGNTQDSVIYENVKRGKWIYNLLRDSSIYEDLKGIYGAWQTPVEDTEFFLLKIKEHLLQVKKHYLDNIHVGLVKTDAYNKKQITKLKLATDMTNRKMLKSLDILEDFHSDLNSKIMDFERKLLYELVVYMTKVYRTSFNISIPVFNMTVLNGLELVKLAYGADNNTGLNEQLQYLQESPAGGLIGIIDVITADYRKVLQEMSSSLTVFGNDITRALEELQEMLQNYKKESQLKDKFFTTNFLRVDVFYKELRYNKVRQQTSFAFLSLLSEVGGFMGLLLGASVLTLCELFDHLIILGYLRFCRAEKPRKSEKDNHRQYDGYTMT